MSQFETTLQLIRERTVAEGFTPELSDIIGADHGTGSKRHRAFTIQEIADLIFGGETDEIVIRTTGGSQQETLTLTLTPSAITFTKVDGQTTTTRKIDFNGEDTKLDSMRVKKLSGATPTGVTSYKLVIDTIVDMVEGLVVGKTDAPKDLTVYGNIDLYGNIKIINGRVDSNVVIGGPGEINSKDLTVVGKVKCDDLNIANHVYDIDSADSLLGFNDGQYEFGDILFVHNTTSSAKKVYFAYIGGPAYIEIKPYCTIPFRCLQAGRGSWNWTPLANVDTQVESNPN